MSASQSITRSHARCFAHERWSISGARALLTLRRYNPKDVPEPLPQFSQVNTFELRGPAKIVACTGQLAITLDGSPPPEDFDSQVRMALQNLENCLKAAGASKRDIFKVTHYVVDFDFGKQDPARIFIEWLGIEHRPASVMMPVARLALPPWKYEIECWAIVPQ